MIGIPYARADVTDDGKLVRICPECGEVCPEQADTTGEQKTNNYADHYAEAHS